MNPSAESRFHDVISGRARGAFPAIARAALRIGEMPYAGVVALRNTLYRSGALRRHAIGRPIICVGNLTTGGTGKTPVVRWLADGLLRAGHRPAVLIRGYKSGREGSDEERLLRQLLDPSIPIHANPDRVAGARAIVRDHSDADMILLDDGFQHHRLHRDFDLVLIDATNPFGHDHLLPRGLLREPVSGLARAGAIVITHVEASDDAGIARIEARIRARNPTAPIYLASHRQTGVNCAGKRIFAFSGIGNPQAFERQLRSVVGAFRFGDHHAYTESDVAAMRAAARDAGADLIVTTEKDWIKLERFVGDEAPDIIPVGVEVEFEAGHDSRLLNQIRGVIGRAPSQQSPAAPAARAGAG